MPTHAPLISDSLKMFAEVVLSKVSREIDKAYHYAIPVSLRKEVKVGSAVIVPFGRRKDVGYVVGFVEKSEYKGIKEIIKVVSQPILFGEREVKLARWISEYYLSFFSSALRLFIPPKRKLAKITVNQPAVWVSSSSLIPTCEQQKALEAIISALDSGKFQKFLLYGITGSGKTEVYLRAITHLLPKGKGAIVLTPEIGLTPQLVLRFRERFGEQVAVLHSDLTLKQRTSEWERIASQKARVVLGTRSAIFAPLQNLGLIVIDEEYEVTYKSEKSPRYHVREVAFELAKLSGAVVIMGSATPSIETFYEAEKGNCQKLVLTKRIDNRPFPPVEVVDLRKEKDRLLSERLKEELKEVLSKKEQAILFINRRGFFTSLICHECGHVIKCPRCSVSLVYHAAKKVLCCNRCGYSVDALLICPNCQSMSLKYFGVGTQRIEKEVAEIFPSARILRYDRDTVTRGAREIFFSTFAEHRADILIGTQMVTKGLDVAKVTLVGVISADTALNLPDFRAAEHTFQLLTQVAGRAGRHHLPGKVIIQTYNPDHYAIVYAAKHDYDGFYQREIECRKELKYPPFSKLINLLIVGPEEKKVLKSAEDLGNFLRRRLGEKVLGPAPSAVAKLRGLWRYQILLKGEGLEDLRQAVKETMEKIVIPKEIKVVVDVDPISLL